MNAIRSFDPGIFRDKRDADSRAHTATRQDDCPTRCGPHPDHGNGLAGEPRLGPSVTLAPVWGVPSSQAASLWRSERNLAMRRGGGRARGGATQEPQQPQGFVPHPSRYPLEPARAPDERDQKF